MKIDGTHQMLVLLVVLMTGDGCGTEESACGAFPINYTLHSAYRSDSGIRLDGFAELSSCGEEPKYQLIYSTIDFETLDLVNSVELSDELSFKAPDGVLIYGGSISSLEEKDPLSITEETTSLTFYSRYTDKMAMGVKDEGLLLVITSGDTVVGYLASPLYEEVSLGP